MSQKNRISVITLSDRSIEETERNSTNERTQNLKAANFEKAIAAAGYGKFQYLLLLAIIPVSWATSMDTASVAIILPSAECDLKMTFTQKGILNAIIYMGMISSGFLWGYIADVKGRRTVFIYGYIADGICNVLSGFSQNFWTLAFFKFLSGFLISGPHASMVTYVSEFYGVKGRVKIPLIIGFSTSFGNIVTSVLSWIIIPQNWSIVLWDGAFVYNSWRIFLSICSLPLFIGVIGLYMFPESPKFLMSEDRMDDALKVFKIIYKINTGKPAEEYPIKHLENDAFKKGSTDSDQDGKMDKKTIFLYPYFLQLILVTLMQFGSMYITNTIRLWQPQLFAILENFDPTNYNLTAKYAPTFCEILDLSSVTNISATISENVTCTNITVKESVYTKTLIVSASGSALLLLASYALNFLNHKVLLHICYGMAFVCIVCMYWSTSTLVTLILTSFFVGLSNTTLNTIVAATVILFPTSLRTIAVSTVMAIGRIGSMIGNILFPILLAQGCFVPIIQLACLVLLCMIVTCFLPMNKKNKK
ncbi:synaptic vesicle glycoprotein 2B-like [Ceratina calcarata]|uniref:Synaptic vesicle glycoprotein 2B-like n=1 Tax=Ceratina calcarata TaxID=156304 RepID=A0AAJ7JDF7_9HYME|nr:synaptic vesicle glycoprotein 2B-like [Ceratina calcarata]